MARINQEWKYDYEEGAFPVNPSRVQEIVDSVNDLYDEEMDSKPFVAWTNPDSTDEFPGQEVTINDNVSNYQYYETIYRRTTGGQAFISTGRIPIGLRNTIEVFHNGFSYTRNLSKVPSGKKITFDSCIKYGAYGSSDNTIDNTKLIPHQIIFYR